MIADAVIKEVLERQDKINELIKLQNLSIQALQKANEDDFDLITVKNASKKWDLSIPKIYNLLNTGKLKRHEIDGKIYLSSKEFFSLVVTR